MSVNFTVKFRSSEFDLFTSIYDKYLSYAYTVMILFLYHLIFNHLSASSKERQSLQRQKKSTDLKQFP